MTLAPSGVLGWEKTRDNRSLVIEKIWLGDTGRRCVSRVLVVRVIGIIIGMISYAVSLRMLVGRTKFLARFILSRSPRFAGSRSARKLPSP